MNFKPALLLAAMLLQNALLAQWIHRTDVGNPGQRSAFALAYDRDRGVTVFFGGEIGAAGDENYYNDTWEYDGIHWQQITINGPKPDTRSGHAMCYDTVRHQVILAGGVNEDGYLNDTWTYVSNGPNQGQWTQRGSIPALADLYAPGVAGHAMAFDEAAGVAVLTGGSGINTLFRDKGWDDRLVIKGAATFNGTSWMQLASDLVENLTRHAMTYDSKNHRMVVFGGYSIINYVDFQDRMTLDGLLNPPKVKDGISGDIITLEVSRLPKEWRAFGAGQSEYLDGPATQQTAMIYDELRNCLVVFGGQDSPRRVFRDRTQQFNGWPEYYATPEYYPSRDDTQRYPYHDMVDLQLSVHPGARAGHAMVYDSRRHVTVLYGGASGDTRFDDTWELPSVPAQGPAWVDFAFGGGNFGAFDFPYATLADGVRGAVAVSRELMLKGPRKTAENITIRDNMTIRAVGGPVTIGQN